MGLAESISGCIVATHRLEAVVQSRAMDAPLKQKMIEVEVMRIRGVRAVDVSSRVAELRNQFPEVLHYATIWFIAEPVYL